MIGRYLATLTTEQEDRVLTSPMWPLYSGGQCCLVVAVHGRGSWFELTDDQKKEASGFRYESLCSRFPPRRINAAIRNRILTNRLRRALTPRPEEAVVHV